MDKEAKRGEGARILETLLIPVPNDTKCVGCHDIIPEGEVAFQSPSVE